MAQKAFIGFRATQEEREALERLARARQTSLSAAVREAIAQAAADLGAGGHPTETKVDRPQTETKVSDGP